MTEDSNELLKSKLNLETAKISWHELQRSFAQGKVIVINNSLDLIDTAYKLAGDDTVYFSENVDKNLINSVSNDQARVWYEDNALFWSVVVAPWVLIQEII